MRKGIITYKTAYRRIKHWAGVLDWALHAHKGSSRSLKGRHKTSGWCDIHPLVIWTVPGIGRYSIRNQRHFTSSSHIDQSRRGRRSRSIVDRVQFNAITYTEASEGRGRIWWIPAVLGTSKVWSSQPNFASRALHILRQMTVWWTDEDATTSKQADRERQAHRLTGRHINTCKICRQT